MKLFCGVKRLQVDGLFTPNAEGVVFGSAGRRGHADARPLRERAEEERDGRV